MFLVIIKNTVVITSKTINNVLKIISSFCLFNINDQYKLKRFFRFTT